VESLDLGITTLVDALVNVTTGEFKKPSHGKWLQTPAEFYKVKGEPSPCDGKTSHKYASYLRKFASSHWINEYSTQIPNADYKKIIPECTKDSDECDKAFVPVYELYWPDVQRAHTFGYLTDVAVPAMSLILGGIARRANVESLSAPYAAMLEAAGKGAAAKGTGPLTETDPAKTHVGNWAEKEKPIFNSALRDDNGAALLMSSHDITTNLLRVIMLVAGLKLEDVIKYNDDVPMGSPNLVTYSFMFVFEVHPSGKLFVKTFAQSPQQARMGCPLTGNHAMKYEGMTTIWTGTAKQFITTVAKSLHDKVGAPSVHTVHNTVKKFLEAASKV